MSLWFLLFEQWFFDVSRVLFVDVEKCFFVLIVFAVWNILSRPLFGDVENVSMFLWFLPVETWVFDLSLFFFADVKNVSVLLWICVAWKMGFDLSLLFLCWC